MLLRCNIYAFASWYLSYCEIISFLFPFCPLFPAPFSDKKSINKNIWWYRKKRFVVQTIPRIIYYARSPLACSPCSKSITDNSDATDLFFSRIIIWLSLYLDFHAPVRRFDLYGLSLAGVYPRRTGANTIRIKSNTKWQHKIKRNPFNPFNPCSFHHGVFFRTRIYL